MRSASRRRCPGTPLLPWAVHLVYPERRLLAKRTRILADAIDAAFSAKACMQPGHLDSLRRATALEAVKDLEGVRP